MTRASVSRALILALAVLCYLSFARVGIYLVGFVADLWVPKTIDSPAAAWAGSIGSPPWMFAAAGNTFWLLLFCAHHSLAARRFFKRIVEKLLPSELERSSYVLVSSLLLAAVMYFWQPLPTELWQVEGLWAQLLRYGGLLGWVLAVTASRSLGHGRVFGVRPAWRRMRGASRAEVSKVDPLETRRLYSVLRHPMYLGFLWAIWVTPRMTAGHLLFALVLTVYVYLGSRLEERDLVLIHGPAFEDYRSRVGGFRPRLRR
jgi:protein-S-isoprenylcysteine O-methyltransferase Ste14